jgi:CRP-like cAMP-binding protein
LRSRLIGKERIMAQASNRILNSLPQNILAALKPHLHTADLVFGATTAYSGEEVTRVYFPHTGVISLVVEMEVGDMVETAMVGRDGVANATASLDGKTALHKGIVQVAGTASVISPDALRSIADDFNPFRSILIRHEQVLLAQAQQSAGCNASHTVEARMCRWLLRMRDLTQSDGMKLTQEFLGQMLGVRRTSVTLVAGTLQRAGLIKYRRGHIEIIDAEAMEASSCECYATVRSHYEKMFNR